MERAPKPVRKPRKQGKPGKLLSLKPFLGSEHSRLLPEGVIFLCAYEVHAQLASGIEAAFLQTARKRWRWGWWLQRKNPSDVLWLVDVDDEELLSRLREGTIPRYCDALPSGKAVWQEDARDNAELFLETLIEARRGFCRPGDVKVEGLVAGDGFREIVARVKGRSDARAKAAEALRDAPIVATAVELGLNPRPSGTGKAAWIATCPGTSHALMIGGDTNTFGCGWCKVSGGQEELRAFVRSRGK